MMGRDYLKLTEGMCGSKCSLDRGAAEYPTNRPPTYPVSSPTARPCVTAPAGEMRRCKLRLRTCGSGTVPPGSGYCELRTLMAVPGRRRSVPTDLIIAARDAPLPWGSGLGTLRVLSRKPRLNPPGFESPGLLTCACVCGRMGSAGRSASARLCTPAVRTEIGIGAHDSGTGSGPESQPSYPRVRLHECVALAAHPR